jgi:uncharacterized protein YjbI with pentapeptide repeats
MDHQARRPLAGQWLVAALIIGALILLAMVVIVLPPVLAPRHAFNDGGDAIRAQNDIRATLLQGLGGHNIRSSREQRDLDRQGQVTERFTRAIDQLGSSEVDVRIGGIYALERIAGNSPPDQAAITAVLAAYVRNHSPWPPQGRTSLPAISRRFRKRMKAEPEPLHQTPLRARAADVQAAMTVLGRRPPAAEEERLELSNVDLRVAYLSRTDLSDAHLWWSNLRGAFLSDARLVGTDFWRSDLWRVELRRADLQGARFIRANLEGAQLWEAKLARAVLRHAGLQGAELQHADLREVDLRWADLRGASLEEAILDGADLEGAQLDGANLKGARADDRTTWPTGFDWRAAGVRAQQQAAPRPAGGVRRPDRAVGDHRKAADER